MALHTVYLGPGNPGDDQELVAAVAAAVARRPGHMRILRRVAALGLPDCWVGAGFVRNAVWDDLHGHSEPTPFVDVDVVYFDPRDPTSSADQDYRAKLMAAEPDIPWSVKNQARMHLRNQDTPYGSTAEALTHWPEICTAVAVRLRDGGVEVLAPFGLQDLFAMVVRPTPHFQSKLDVYRARLLAKRWQLRWPGLRIDCIA